MNTYDQIARYSNHLTTLLKMFPDKPWDWYGLSQNPNITWQAILDNLDKPWNWYYISHNPNITWKNIYDNLDKPWDWSGISINPNVTWHNIVQTSSIVQQIGTSLNEFSELPWNWCYLSS